MASVLIAYGGLLAGLGLVLHHVAPVSGKVTFIVGLAGGGLSLLWGLTGLAGLKRRVWACLSAISTLVVLLSQAVHVWMTTVSAEGISMTMRLVVTVMFMMTMGMVLYLFHGERPPDFYSSRTARRDNPSSRGLNVQPPATGPRP